MNDRDEAIGRMYLHDGMSVWAISQHFGLSPEAVRVVLLRQRIARRRSDYTAAEINGYGKAS